MGLSGLSDEELHAWVQALSDRQGVPVKVSDARVREAVVVLLGGPVGGPRAHARRASTRPPAARS